jgi:hypothetical protein
MVGTFPQKTPPRPGKISSRARALFTTFVSFIMFLVSRIFKVGEKMEKSENRGRPRKRGRPKRYQWNIWFKQNRFTLKRGVHYDATQSAMAQMIRNAAVRAGVKVSVVEGESWFTVVLVNRDGDNGRDKG